MTVEQHLRKLAETGHEVIIGRIQEPFDDKFGASRYFWSVRLFDCSTKLGGATGDGATLTEAVRDCFQSWQRRQQIELERRQDVAS